MNGSAVLSTCRTYRYRLDRWWDDGSRVLFVMLNPSKADAEQDDPTIKKCCGFAQRWGYGGITVVNLYAYRATNPDLLLVRRMPLNKFGRDNAGHSQKAFAESVKSSAPIIGAWGAHKAGKCFERALTLPMIVRLKCLGQNADGSPKHPVRLAYDTPIVALDRKKLGMRV